ncbi:MAG: DegV family protein [Dehalococcoidales bacterium]|nr:DegV family protein [Dehalococcoidales bacterium]
MPVRIVTDSTADLTPQLARELGITVVPVYVRFGHESYRDGIDISREEFYERLVTSPVHPTTSQPTPADFAQVYRELSRETDKIVSIHVSSKLSCTCNSALQGKELAETKCDIKVIDSESVTMGLGMMTLAAARLAASGESLQKVTDDVKQAIPNTHLLGVFDTLKYLLLGGRIGKAKALLGGILNVKPLLTLRDGELHPVGNVRTRAKGIERLSDFVKNALGIQELAVIHTTTPDEASRLKDRLSSLVDTSRLHLARLGPALGVHTGPGLLAVVLRKKSTGDKDEAQSTGRKIHVPSLHLPKVNLPHR